MTLNIAVGHTRHSPCAIVAADKRACYREGKQAVAIGDFGGKLFRIGSGWMAFAGDTQLKVEILEQIVADSVRAGRDADCMDIERMHRIVTSSAVHRGGVIVGSRVTRQVACVRSDGSIDRFEDGAVVVSYPSGYVRMESEAGFEARLQAANNECDVLRAVFAEFAAVAGAGLATVSDTVECGYGDGLIVGKASELAVASDAELRAAWDPAPLSVQLLGADMFTHRSRRFDPLLNAYVAHVRRERGTVDWSTTERLWGEAA
jgi:hypothetical protein